MVGRSAACYALKVLAGQLAEDPDMGRPSGLPGILTVTVDAELFEDCPALRIGYIREPDRVEIRYVCASLDRVGGSGKRTAWATECG